MQCQSLSVPKLEQNYPQIPTLIDAVARYSLMCANVCADRELPWFTMDIAKEIFEIAQPPKMLELFSAQQEEFGEQGFQTDKNLGMPPVIVHGDLWPGNILWEKGDGDKEAKMLTIIDWQNCYGGDFWPSRRFFRLVHHRFGRFNGC